MSGSSVAAALPISMTRAPCSGSPSLRSSIISETRGIGEDVLGVHGQPRDQQQRRAVGGGRHIDQRAIGIAGTGHQGRQRARPALAQELLGGYSGLKSGVGFIGASSAGVYLPSAAAGVKHRIGCSRTRQLGLNLASTWRWRLRPMGAMLSSPLTNHVFVRDLSHFGLAFRASKPGANRQTGASCRPSLSSTTTATS